MAELQGTLDIIVAQELKHRGLGNCSKMNQNQYSEAITDVILLLSVISVVQNAI